MRSVVSEGKTTNEAIENGLKELKVSRENVEIKVLESSEKKSFFSILAPRVVKVELTVKEGAQEEAKKEKSVVKEHKEIEYSEAEIDIIKNNIDTFFEKLLKNLPEGTKYEILIQNGIVHVDITGENVGFLIGYRGETLYAMQDILSSVANKNVEKKVILRLDIEKYKERREKTLQELAEKVARTVVKTRKSITLEPMQAYERKIIHATLQNNNKVTTNSVGEEPRRRIIISLK
jgi:spoIIIJ-associated protein